MEPEGLLPIFILPASPLPVTIPSQFNPVQVHPYHFLILSFCPCLGLPNGLLPSGFPIKTLYALFLSPIRATCPAHHILLDFITRIISAEQCRSLSSSLCSFLQSPVNLLPLGPNTLLKTLFSNILSLRSSLNMSGQVSYSHKTGKIIVMIY